ncbi:hypothetical protein TD95_004297, partial [Thielaviopsis punctulata]
LLILYPYALRPSLFILYLNIRFSTPTTTTIIMKFFSAAGVLASLLSLASAAGLTKVNNFGSNPTNAQMYTYVPDNVSASPQLVLVIHYCGGTAQAMYSNTDWKRYADQYGFVLVFPQTPNSNGCWDVSSRATLIRDGGGDSTSIANMVKYAVKQHKVNTSKMYVTGTSSGAMMTNVMAATYPDMFAGASSYAGVAAGCFYTGTVAGWNSTCSQGKSVHTQEQWAATARAMDPGYTGSRPTMLIYHGTDDTTINPQNQFEAIKQWTGIFGYSTTPSQTLPGSPGPVWTTRVYGPKVRGITGAGVTHAITMQVANDMAVWNMV